MALNRKGQIVKQATKLFSKKGYQKITMKNIAGDCGITEAALYKHFKSKDEIYLAVLKLIQSKVSTEDLFGALENEQNVEKILTSIARHIITSFNRHQDVLRLLLFSSLEKHSMAQEIFNATRVPYIKFLVVKFDSLAKTGKLQDFNSVITARCFVGMVFDCAFNMCLWRGMAGPTFDPEVIFNNNIAIFVRGLAKFDEIAN